MSFSAPLYWQPVPHEPIPASSAASATEHSLPPCAAHSSAAWCRVTRGWPCSLLNVTGLVQVGNTLPIEMPRPPCISQHRTCAVDVAARHSTTGPHPLITKCDMDEAKRGTTGGGAGDGDAGGNGGVLGSGGGGGCDGETTPQIDLNKATSFSALTTDVYALALKPFW